MQEPFWLALLSSFGPIIVGLAGIYFGFKQYKKTLDSKSQENERDEIYKKLNDFYGPLLQLRKKSELLYLIFSADLKSDNPQFRTITHLLEGRDLTKNQRELLEEIINIGEQCENLIHDKSGLIDDKELRNETLPKFTSHLLMLRMAFKNRLEGKDAKFQSYTFPRNLDKKLEDRIEELQSRLNELNKID